MSKASEVYNLTQRWRAAQGVRLAGKLQQGHVALQSLAKLHLQHAGIRKEGDNPLEGCY